MLKTIIFLITAIINTGIGTLIFFILIMSLNGFTEKQAKPGLILFIVWVLLCSIIVGIFSFLGANYLIEKKSLNQWVAALIAIVGFAVIGAIIDFVGFLVAIFLTAAMR